jgi:hypothetical protein
MNVFSMHSLNTILVGYEHGIYGGICGGICGGNWDQLIESQ